MTWHNDEGNGELLIDLPWLQDNSRSRLNLIEKQQFQPAALFSTPLAPPPTQNNWLKFTFFCTENETLPEFQEEFSHLTKLRTPNTTGTR